MTATEQRDASFVANALPGLEEQTGVPRSQIHLSIVHTEASGGWDFVVARPHLARLTVRLGEVALPEPNPDRWWVWDPDEDESECWLSQAVFSPAGFIDFTTFERTMDAGRLDNGEGEDDGEPFPAWEGTVQPTEDTPRDPHAPVTVSIDLEEHETADREGIPAWEEHERFGVLVNENGFAVVHDTAVGIVRYPDRTACTVSGRNAKEAREQAEKFLANRPYKTAMQRVLEEPEFDAPDPEPEKPFDPPTSPAVPQARPAKRVWKTVPITSGEDED